MFEVVVINGSGGSGKDTFIDFFAEVIKSHPEDSDTKVFRVSSVDEVKEIAANLGWDGVKDDRGRRFLCDIKDALTRYNDRPLNYMLYKVNEIKRNTHNNAVVFLFIREPEEIRKFIAKVPSSTLLIRREDVESFTNHADSSVFDFQYDVIFDNSGSLEELRDKAETFYGILKYWEGCKCHL